MHRIGVFDSGIGGLTVLRQRRRAFPQLDMVYLGDTARVPYGGRSVETITHYAEDDVRFLLRKDVEAIVIACGTVSSNSLDALREKFDLPLYGVIESAARLAASMTKTRSVGVIGTQATVKSLSLIHIYGTRLPRRRRHRYGQNETEAPHHRERHVCRAPERRHPARRHRALGQSRYAVVMAAPFGHRRAAL